LLFRTKHDYGTSVPFHLSHYKDPAFQSINRTFSVLISHLDKPTRLYFDNYPDIFFILRNSGDLSAFKHYTQQQIQKHITLLEHWQD